MRYMIVVDGSNTRAGQCVLPFGLRSIALAEVVGWGSWIADWYGSRGCWVGVLDGRLVW